MFGFRIISEKRHRLLLRAETELLRLHTEVEKLDNALNDAEISPNGDDYNRMWEIVMGCDFQNDIRPADR